MGLHEARNGRIIETRIFASEEYNKRSYDQVEKIAEKQRMQQIAKLEKELAALKKGVR